MFAENPSGITTTLNGCNKIVEEPEESEDAYEMFAEDPSGERAKTHHVACNICQLLVLANQGQ